MPPKRRKRLPRNWSELSERQREKHEAGTCIHRGCNNESERHSRTRTVLLVCKTCRWIDYTARNPIRVKFLNLKKSAKRRGKSWSVTWPRFKALAEAAGYNEFTPKTDAATLSVNRVPEGPLTPYSDDTIEIIPLGDNARLAAEHRREIRQGFVPYFRDFRNASVDPATVDPANCPF